MATNGKGVHTKKTWYGREVIDGSPVEDCRHLTTGTTTFTGDVPTGVIALAESVITLITVAGTSVASITVPAGAMLPVKFTSITVTSGSVIVLMPDATAINS